MWNWPNVLTGFGTIFMAIAVVVTAFYAIKTWRKSIKRDKQDLTGKLFREFNSNAEITTGLQFLSYSENNNQVFKSNAIELILFFTKLGKLLKEEIITIEEVMIYFYNYLFYEERMLVLIKRVCK